MSKRARMGEYRFENVTEALRGSGLIDLMYPQYRILLTCMADMADACGGREFPASHTQIAKRTGCCRQGSMTPELVAELVFDFIRLGIVEVAPARGPVTYRTGTGKERWRRVSRDERTAYRFGNFDRFVELAEEIRRLQANSDASLLPPVVPRSSPRRATKNPFCPRRVAKNTKGVSDFLCAAVRGSGALCPRKSLFR